MRSVLMASAITEFLFAAMLASTWRDRRAPMSLTYWSLGSFLAGLSFLVVGLRGQIPDLISIEGSNLVGYWALGLRLAGMRSFAGQPVRLRWLLLPGVALALLFHFREPLGLDVGRRVLITGVVGLGFGLLMVADLSRAQREEPLTMRRIVIAVIGLQTLNDVVRLVVGVLGGFAGNQYLSPQATFVILLLNVLCLYGVLNLACFMMLFERNETRLVRAATLDALTSLLNRAGFRQLAERQRQRSLHDGQPLSVLVMDLDHFKRVNDRYGHAAGDQVLQAFARSARASLRPTDLLSRSGGEEFWALLPNTDLDEALSVAERVCLGFRKVQVWNGDQLIQATVSIGAAEMNRSGESIQAALARADQALYIAKREGRDRVHRAGVAVLGSPLPAGA